MQRSGTYMQRFPIDSGVRGGCWILGDQLLEWSWLNLAETRAAIMHSALLFWDNLSFWCVAGGMFLKADQ